jgi:hypothetical protein
VGFALSDSGARTISALIFLASLAGAIYFSYQFTNVLAERGLPDALASRLYGYAALILIRGLVIVLAVFVPTLLGLCALANAWTTRTSLEAGYLRAGRDEPADAHVHGSGTDGAEPFAAGHARAGHRDAVRARDRVERADEHALVDDARERGAAPRGDPS